jgi:hypothetical protein
MATIGNAGSAAMLGRNKMQRLHLEQPSTKAAEARVSPEELADALARLEARREREAAQRMGTIPLGETLRELEIDRSPEEVLAEVEALRTASRTLVPVQSAVPEVRVRLALVSACLLAVALALGTLMTFSRAVPPPMMLTPPTVVQPVAEVGDLDRDGRPDLYLGRPRGSAGAPAPK